MFGDSNFYIASGVNSVLSHALTATENNGMEIPEPMKEQVDRVIAKNNEHMTDSSRHNCLRLINSIEQIKQICEMIEDIQTVANRYKPRSPWGCIESYDEMLDQITEGLVCSTNIDIAFGNEATAGYMRTARELREKGLRAGVKMQRFADKLYNHNVVNHRIRQDLRARYTLEYVMTETVRLSNTILLSYSDKQNRSIDDARNDVKIISFYQTIAYMISQHHYEEAGVLMAEMVEILNAMK